MINLKKFPKVELHLHLDGSIRIGTAHELLNVNENDMVAPSKCLDLNDYLTKFSLPISVLQTKENIMRVCKELINDLIDDGVIYAEIRFAPINHIKQGLSLEEVVESVLQGLQSDMVKTNIILCLMRNSSYEENLSIINLASKYLNKGVCALDLAGAEGLYKTNTFKDLFLKAKEKQIPFTIHAGEADGVDSIKSAIEFGTKRIGHGIRCIESEDVINKIIKDNITLEVCPTSNVQTNVVATYENHPIKYLYDKGIKVTISTDNRTVSNITLIEEYQKLIDTFKFTLEDIKRMNIFAINSSFLSDTEKENLIIKYNTLYEEFISNNNQ